MHTSGWLCSGKPGSTENPVPLSSKSKISVTFGLIDAATEAVGPVTNVASCYLNPITGLHTQIVQ